MSKKQVTLREQIAAFQKNGSYVGDLATFGYFFDWFCSDRALENKSKRMMPKVIKFALKQEVDLDATYVIFKNNCPMDGSLYDDFRICDIATQDVIWTVCPALGYSHTKGEAEVWGSQNGFTGPIIAAKNWTALMATL